MTLTNLNVYHRHEAQNVLHRLVLAVFGAAVMTLVFSLTDYAAIQEG